MATVKCQGCGKRVDKETAFLHVHYTKTGNKSNKWYCSLEEYENIEKEKEMLLECKYATDAIIGYPIENNVRNKMLSELHKNYSYETIYNYIKDESDRIESIMVAKDCDLDNEYNKIAYMFGIIKSGIKDYEYKESKSFTPNVVDTIDEYKGNRKKVKTNKPTLMDIIRGKSNGR